MPFLWSLLLSAIAFSNSVQDYISYVEQLNPNQFHTETIEDYQTLYTAHKQISNIVQKYSGRVEPLKIGSTVQNHPIWAFRISNPMEKPQHRILVFAGLHAMEWMGLDVSLESLQTLA